MTPLEMNDVFYRYKGAERDVLRHASASFETGRFYAVTGGPGAGKSTLLFLLAGLDVCTRGEIAHNGRSLVTLDRDAYRAGSIGAVFQSGNLIANATAVENIVLTLDIGGSTVRDKKTYAYSLLQKMGVGRDSADKKAGKLPPEAQMRSAIARALALDPCILLADEPTGGLDAEGEQQIIGLLAAIAHEEDKCVVIVTRSKKIASAADEIWALAEGNLLSVR